MKMLGSILSLLLIIVGSTYQTIPLVDAICDSNHPELPSGECALNFGEGPCDIDLNLCYVGFFLVCGDLNTCECASGHTEQNQKCLANFNDPCDLSNDLCDSSKFLACNPINNKCNCDDEHPEIPSKNGVCGQKFNDLCDLNDDLCSPTLYLSCDANESKCRCAEGHRQNGTAEMCHANFREICKVGNDNCDPEGHLICEPMGQCVCDAHHKVHLDGDACAGNKHDFCHRVPEKCDTTEYLICGPNDLCSCDPDHPDHATSGGCTAYYEEFCNVMTNNCHLEGFLECSPNGFCECAPDHQLDPLNQKNCLGNKNESCDLLNINCNKADYLTCNPDMKCVCDISNGHTDHPEHPTACRAFYNQSCDLILDNCDPDGFLLCGKGGKCECKPNHLPYEGGNCTANFNDNCGTNPDLCNPSAYLICGSAKKCECLPDHPILSPGICSARKGDKCQIGPGDDICNPAAFLHCNGTICICDDGHEANNADWCTANLGEHCDDFNAKCSDGQHLVCTSNKCICDKDHPQLPSGDKCAAIKSEPCTLDEDCDPAAFLVCGGKKCVCSQDHHDKGTHCAANYGDSCHDSGSGGFDNCDEDGYLVCQNGKCRCQVGHNYQGLYCSGLYNDTCDPSRDFCDPNLYLECTPQGRCDCQSGHLYHPKAGCRAYFGQRCNTNVDNCDPDGYLVCSNDRKCSCGKNAQYNVTTSSCYLLEGAECDPDSSIQDRQLCLSNSYCDSQSVCRCQGNMKPNSNRLCYLPLGETCNSENDLCDLLNFQYCDPLTLKCTCQNSDQVVVSSGHNCRLRANSLCSPYPGDQLCTQNSQCLLTNYEMRCVCDGHLQENSAGKCTLGFNSTCNSNSGITCNEEGFQFCQSTSILTTNRCQCMDPQQMKFNSTDKNCYYKLHSPCPTDHLCEPGLICAPTSNDVSHKICVKNFDAECDLDESNGGCSEYLHLKCYLGRCECAPGYTPIQDDAPFAQGAPKCLGIDQTPCKMDEDCNHHQGSLVCQPNEVCGCFLAEQQIYDLDVNKCYTIKGGRCNTTAVPEDVMPSTCDPKWRCRAPRGDLLEPPYDGRCGGSRVVSFSFIPTFVIIFLFGIFII